MKTIIRISTVLTILVALAASGPAFAQTTDDLSRLKDEIDRNAELLMQAKEFVAQTGSAKARASLQISAELHQESVRLFGMGPGDGNIARAAHMTARARESILQTIAIAKRESKLEESAKKAIERATMRLERARQLFQNTDQAAVAPRKLLEEAHDHLQRANHNMREHLYEVAARLAASSEELSTRAIALIRRDVSDAAVVKRELERTDRVLERLAEQAGDNEKVRRVLDEAMDLQRRAKAAASEGRPRAALELTERARSMAMRALRQASGGANEQNVARALALTDQLLERATELARERDSESLAASVAEAQRLQTQAHGQFDQANYERALRMTLRAREMLKNAIGGEAHDINKADVERALAGTDEAIERAGARIAGSGDDVAEDLFARAEAKQREARESFEQGRLRAALAKTKLARNLLRRAVAKLRGDDT